MSLEARDLILNLLNRNPKKRLGAGPEDADELKKHKFFEGVNWQEVQQQRQQMPYLQVTRDVKFNASAEADFNREEKESLDKMQKIMVLMKKGEKIAPKSSKNEQETVDFLKNPENLKNWSFVGEEALRQLK